MATATELVKMANLRATLAMAVAYAGDVPSARVHVLAGQMALAAARRLYSDEASSLPPVKGEECLHAS